MEWGLTEGIKVGLSAGTQKGKNLDNCERIKNKKNLLEIRNGMKEFSLLCFKF